MFEYEEALYRAGLLRGDQLPEVAMRMVEAGVESPDAYELALLRDPTLRDAGELFERALRALRRPQVSEDEARRYLRRGALQAVATGEVTPIEGARRLWWLWSEFGHPEDLSTFVYLEDLWGDYPAKRAAIDREIVERATALLAAESDVQSA